MAGSSGIGLTDEELDCVVMAIECADSEGQVRNRVLGALRRQREVIAGAMRTMAEEMKDEAYCNHGITYEDSAVLLGGERALTEFADRISGEGEK